ncbi:MAG: glycosyltransferase family 4 protein, partial [Terriglobia bacterium]
VFPYDAHRQYFQEQLLPLLLPPHRHLGPVDFERKIRLLAGAKCLLVPSVAAETSSLVTMEALACGTPVIAFRSGALPELIDDGRTGFLVRNAAEMASAIGRTKEINSQECRREAERRFSANRMANDYFEYYVQIAAGKSVKVQRVAELRARSNTRQHFAIRCAPPGNL